MTFLYLTLLLLTGIVCSFSEELDEASESIEPEYLDSLLKEKKYEEFARLLGIENVEHVIPSKGKRSRPMFKKSLYGGDIMLTKAQAEQARQGMRFDRNPNAKWSGSPAQIPYTISRDTFSSSERRAIRKAVAEWNRLVSCVQWVERTKERDYVNFFSGEGCWSVVGRGGKVQGLSLEAPNCVTQPVMLHEMNHAAGFTHEQERSDRDNYIRILWDNIPDEWKPQYEKANEEEYGLQSNYDYYSIMHYTLEAPDTDGLHAFEILQSGIDGNRIGNGETFTDTDLEKLSIQYC